MWAIRSSIGRSSSSRVLGERCSPFMSFWLHDAFESLDSLRIRIGFDHSGGAGARFRRSRGGLAWRPVAHFPCAARFFGFVFGFLLQSTHFFHRLEDQNLVDSGIASFTQTLLSGLNLPATDGRPGAIAVRDRDVGVADWVPEINFTH